MIRHLYFAAFFLISPLVNGQYTDQINSNRPGASIGAFSVGKGVIQVESGLGYQKYKHTELNNSIVTKGVISVSFRWGLLKEQLELNYEGGYLINQRIHKKTEIPTTLNQKGILQNILSVKYLVFDPFKKEKKVNLYSWKANNGFKIKDLIPAVSLTLGAGYNPNKNYDYAFGYVSSVLNREGVGTQPEQESSLYYRGILATQSHFLGTWVFVTNFIYDRIAMKHSEKSYILALTHAFHPLWSIYIENQGIYSNAYKDNLFRVGGAYLLTDDFQIYGTIGGNIKATPSTFFINAGISYRLDFHKKYKNVKAKEKADKNSKEVSKKHQKKEKI